MYSTVEYHVWTSMSDVHIRVFIPKEWLDVLGETRAVREAVWDKLFFQDPTTAKALRNMGKTYVFAAGTSIEDAHQHLKDIVCQDLKYKRVTIDRSA